MVPTPGSTSVQGVHPGVRVSVRPDIQSSGLACGLECSRTSARMPVRSGVQAGVRPAPERIACQKGLSAAQVNVISLLLSLGPSITQYGQLAAELEQHYGMERSPEAIRRTVERLVGRGFIRRRQTREGTLHGISFAIIEDRLCPHIRPPVRLGVRADEFSPLSILEEEERKNLSISSGERHRAKLEALAEEDIAFHWPYLARAGFGTAQIRQIIQRREQVCESVDLIMQGLTFAEWELEHQAMKDAKGNAIAAPLNWIFSILATQGYYPRPSGYVSPVEQAERDRESILKNEQEAREARFNAEAESWTTALSPAEREAILGPEDAMRLVIPEAVRLRQHFKAKVWPNILITERKTT